MNKSNTSRKAKPPITKVYRFKEQFKAATLKENQNTTGTLDKGE